MGRTARRSRVSPEKDALNYIKSGTDKPELKEQFISTYKGERFLEHVLGNVKYNSVAEYSRYLGVSQMKPYEQNFKLYLTFPKH